MVKHWLSHKFLFTLILCGILLAVLMPRLAYFISHLNPERVTELSIGTKPYSDAYGWYQGSYLIREGKYLSGVSSRRPLYPVFLTALSSLFRDNYNAILATQIIFYSAVAFLAISLLAENSLIMALILGFYLALLRIDLPSLFMTENLGLFLAIPGTAFTLYALSRRKLPLFCFSLFLLGLSQLARPFALATLITLPFMAFFWREAAKKKAYLLLLFVGLIIILPVLLHVYINLLFNPNSSDSYSPVLYGLANGGVGWMAAEKDPQVVKARMERRSEREVNKIIRQLALNKIMTEPKLFLSSVYLSYKSAWKNIWSLFNESGSIAKYLYRLTFIPGMLYLLRNYTQPVFLFIILYYAGIIISIPLVGNDGGLRALASSYPVFILTSVFGFKLFLDLFYKLDKPHLKNLQPGLVKGVTVGMTVFIIGFFIVMPSIVFYRARASNKQDNRPYPYGASTMFNSLELIPQESLWDEYDKWPNADLAKFNGKYLFFELDFHKNRFSYLKAQQGLDDNSPLYQIYYWPMAKKNYSRYTGWTDLASGQAIWLEIPSGLLKQPVDLLEGKRIGIVGKIVSRNVEWKYNTFMTVIAQNIFYDNREAAP